MELIYAAPGKIEGATYRAIRRGNLVAVQRCEAGKDTWEDMVVCSQGDFMEFGEAAEIWGKHVYTPSPLMWVVWAIKEAQWS